MRTCRLCGHELGQPFLSLGPSPLSNAYLSEEDLHREEPRYPLDVYFCGNCSLVQVEEFEPPDSIFTAAYAYCSSYSESWLRHCRDYTRAVISRFHLGRNSFVIEIGSNDGALLRCFHDRGIPVMGVEPAAGPAAVARERGLATDIAFFGASYAATLAGNGSRADLIAGNNVLAHNPGLHDFVEGLRLALKPGGVVSLEVPHLLLLLEQNQFDTIYHEHYSYFSLQAAQRLFSSHHLLVFDVEEVSTHGGSLRLFARHEGNESEPVTGRVAAVAGREAAAGLCEASTYERFRKTVERTRDSLVAFLTEARNEGKRIAGYGAPAKGNTLLNYCAVGTDLVAYTVDRNPNKQGKYLPGSRIPVADPGRIAEDRPDYVLILPWNIRDEIMEQLGYIRTWGGKFVVPIPEIEVL